MATKYYAVKNGRMPGIYKTWDECNEQVKGYSGAEFKKFDTNEQAEEFILGKSIENDKNIAIAYTDGSYDNRTGVYSYGVYLQYDGREIKMYQGYKSDEYSKHRNVAGEVKAVIALINYCYEHSIKSVSINYDYNGVEYWATGEWKANKELTIKYQNFMKDAQNKMHIEFHSVKSHSGVFLNDVADALAKKGLKSFSPCVEMK